MCNLQNSLVSLIIQCDRNLTSFISPPEFVMHVLDAKTTQKNKWTNSINHLFQNFLHSIHCKYLLSTMAMQQNSKCEKIWSQPKISNLLIQDVNGFHVTLQMDKNTNNKHYTTNKMAYIAKNTHSALNSAK